MAKTTELTPLRVALYIRVSSQEQSIKGLSLEAQQEDLECYAHERGWIVTGIYADAGKTARKRLNKRDRFAAMLESVARDEVDLILFTRLDRWFRNIADYYKVVEILDAHNCGWLTTQEQYDTTTASGRLYINLRLSIAQNEADLTGERISAVFDSKIKHGTYLTGVCPFGYRVGADKRLEIVPEEAEIVRALFERYVATVSKRGSRAYIRENYGVAFTREVTNKILTERLYTGYYERNGRLNPTFCPPIISPELFEHVQRLGENSPKAVPSGRVYLFTGILVCAECGRRLASICTHGYIYYRCERYKSSRTCVHQHSVSESWIERWLFENLGQVIAENRAELDAEAAKRSNIAVQNKRAAIKRKLTRLKDLYINDAIDLGVYKRDYEELTAQLADLPLPEEVSRPNFEAVESLLAADYRPVYDALSREEKRAVWHNAIRTICVNNDLEVTRVVFC